MRPGRILWRIYIYFLGATLAALALATGYAVRSLRAFHEEQVADGLRVRVQFFREDLSGYSLANDVDRIDRLCKKMGDLTDTRITVVLPGGDVIGDSDKDPRHMDNHGSRPEIEEALRGNIGEAVRFSNTLKQSLKYVALPLRTDGRITAIVRASQPLSQIRWTRRVISQQILFGGIAACLFFAVVALFLSRRITRPLEDMRRVAQDLAAGNMDSRMVVSASDEVSALAQSLNEMAEQLSDRMATIRRQQVEQQAVLTCMVEGVLAIDTNADILYLNDAAARLLHTECDTACGRSVQEVVRNHHLQEAILATLSGDGLVDSRVLTQGMDERHLRVHGTPLTDSDGTHIGGLVVMNDITTLKRLETVRSDFVANVSHELKTPITALKGCVDTLSGDTPMAGEDAARFVAMMSRHVDRLEAIVEDLLSLSRMEFDADHGQVDLAPVEIAPVLARSTELFGEAAAAKGIALRTSCPEGLVAVASEALLAQAVGNLLDNAIKYSGENTAVAISACEEEDQVTIRVADHGPGMAKKHLPRIFERFYRSDSARSRGLGGTGLGLSIVKHIALAHHGNVSVQSELGEGTTFSLHLPRG